MRQTKKRRRKTIDQRFDDWWRRATWLHHNGEVPLSVGELKTYVRVGYVNGWNARTRTPK